MTQIKQKRRPSIDFPSGRGTGLPAAGVHAVDRKLGALPVDFRLQGASGQPSSAADSGYSRATLQRVNRGFEYQKSLEDIPEVSWLKQNAEQLNSMGLTPRLVAEMYKALCEYTPKNNHERQLLRETHRRVLGTRRKINSVTRAALHESRASLHEFLDMDTLAAGAKSLIGNVQGLDPGAPDTPAPDSLESKQMLLKSIDPEIGGGSVTQDELDDAMQSHDVTAGVLACNSNSLEIFQTTLAVTGIVGDVGTFLGVPIGMVSDAFNACINIMCKHYFHAFLDVIAIVPFMGDFAKIFYAKRLVKKFGIANTSKLATGSWAEQVEAAVEIIENAIINPVIGPQISKKILRLRSTFQTSKRMADSLVQFLRRILDRAISFLEDIKAGAAAGSLTMKGASWALSKLPVDLLAVLKSIKNEGLTNFRKFVEGLFSRKSTQLTASTAQVKDPALEKAEDILEPESSDVYLTPAEMPTGSAEEFLSSEVQNTNLPSEEFLGYDALGDDQKEVLRPTRPGSEFTFSGNEEGTLREGKQKKKARRLSLSKAMAGDDSEIDEMSTVATSLGTPGQPGSGGYIGPLGAKPPGAPRRRLDKLVPGYEFARGRYPYSY